MPTYLYECPTHGEFEYQHSINDELQYCPYCEEKNELIDGERVTFQKVKRLIAGGTTFVLSGGGWARDNYN